jgi:hypothetical protein
MTRNPKSLPRLTGLCQMLSDTALATLMHATRQKAETQALLDQLSQIPSATDLGLVQIAQAELMYQSWVGSRRANLNLLLAEQTIAVNHAKIAAGLALGRVESLTKISKRQDPHKG